MTAYGSEDIAIRALQAGASNYVPKKALSRDLAETIDAVLALADVDLRRRSLLRCVESNRSTFVLGNDPDLFAPLIAMLQVVLDVMAFCDGTGRSRVGVAARRPCRTPCTTGIWKSPPTSARTMSRLFYAEAQARRREPPYRDRRIHVLADLDRDAATYRIRDEGPGFDVARLDAPFDPESLMRVGGRGLLLIRTFMDEVRHNATGDEITMIKRRRIDRLTGGSRAEAFWMRFRIEEFEI